MNRLASIVSLFILITILLTGVFTCAAFAQHNAIPYLNQPLSPENAAPGSGAFNLTVSGTGFVSGATLYWNGSARATTFVDSSRLTAAILATDVAKSSTAGITVVNPAPGGGTSNVVYFTIGLASSSLALTGTVYSNSGGNQNLPDGAVAAGDFNHDGKLDIVATEDDGLLTFLGNGNGSFTSPLISTGTMECGSIPGQTATGDFNNDGKLDLVVVTSLNQFCIFLGNGDGSFTSGAPINIGTVYFGVTPVVGDFNGDGNLDLAFTVENSLTVSVAIFLGNGDGSFQNPVQYSAEIPTNGPQTLAMGDFNGDGKLDLIVAGDGFAILLGNGDGSFQPGVSISSGVQYPTALAVADFNGDGKLDIAVSESSSFSLAVALGNGDGTFQPAVNYPSNYDSECTVLADFNNDGKLDLGCSGGISQSNVYYAASVLLGNGDGSFQPALNFIGQQASPYAYATGGDFNNDGRFDLATGASGYVETFVQTTVLTSPGSLRFPYQSVGTKSKPQRAVVTNQGKSHLTIASIKVTGTNAADFQQTNTCGKGLNPGQQCTITATMTPSVSGGELAAVSISDNAVASPQTISLVGTGTDFLFSPTTLNFGDVAVGQSSQLTETLKNAGSVYSIEVVGIGLYGADASDFSQTNNCPPTLAAGQSCQITVTFRPGSTGTRSSTLDIYNSPINVFVQGVGTAAAFGQLDMPHP